jgi:hypothetical protein
VLCAALAAILAAILGIWESASLRVPYIEKWLVVLCLSVYPIAGFAVNILKSYGSDLGERRIKLADPGSAEERLRFIIRGFFYAGLAFAAYDGAAGVSTGAMYTAVVVFLVMIASSTYGLTQHYSRTEIKRPQKYALPVWLGIMGCVFVPISAVFLWLSWEYLQGLFPIVSGKPVAEFRIATLLLVAAFIVQMLPIAIQRPITLSQLLRLRRDLFLSRITTDEAWLHTEIAVMGMNATARREYYCRDLADMHIAFQRSWDTVGSQLQKLGAEIQAATATAPNQIGAMQKHLAAAESSVAKARQRLRKLEKYQTSRLAKMAQGETSEDVAEITSAESRLAPSYSRLLQAIADSTRLIESADGFLTSAHAALNALAEIQASDV